MSQTNGKGDTPRPETKTGSYGKGWDRIFKRGTELPLISEWGDPRYIYTGQFDENNEWVVVKIDTWDNEPSTTSFK